ncbi:MAG TPA: energy transducer TonB [Flavobacteriales bacterium]|nr:energy transducer TonB [Flavobacteriales bacterium]
MELKDRSTGLRIEGSIPDGTVLAEVPIFTTMKLRITVPFCLLFTTAAIAQQDAVMDVAVPHAEEAPDTNEPFTIVEQMPEFPGGQEAMTAYISKNLKYPEKAIEEGIEGVVFITFVVEPDGRISGVTVLRGIGAGCNEEAVRVVSSMPNWKPGYQRGKAVRVKYNLPIRYKLAEGKK